MNKQGQLQLGIIMGVFIIALVGVVLFQITAQETSKSTDTLYNANTTYTLGADSVAINLDGKAVVGDAVVTNATSGTVVTSDNYTLADNQVVNGVLTATIAPTASSDYSEMDVNITYTYQPEGYIVDGGGRAIADLIPLFFILGIVILLLLPVIKAKLFD